MRDAWIYGRNSDRAARVATLLAELGFSPRQIGANGALRPSGADGAAARPPELAFVVSERELCERLRADASFADVPVLLGLAEDELGSTLPDIDELLVAPFTAAELEARIARASRPQGTGEVETVSVDNLEVNLQTFQVTIGGHAVDFTYTEYALLRFLVTHPGRVFSREALLNRVWGYDYYGGSRTVDVHVRRLRAKLGQEHAVRITTVRGVGYRFDR